MVVRQEGIGSCWTGISEAAPTRASRKIEPRSDCVSSDQRDDRTGTAAKMPIHVAAPTNGKL